MPQIGLKPLKLYETHVGMIVIMTLFYAGARLSFIYANGFLYMGKILTTLYNHLQFAIRGSKSVHIAFRLQMFV